MKRLKKMLTLTVVICMLNIAVINTFAYSYSIAQQVDSSDGEKREYLYQFDDSLGLGEIQDSHPADESKIDINNPNSINRSLPSKKDLSQKKYFPQIRSQGSFNSCTSWATTYYQFTYQVAKLNDWSAKNNSQYQYSPKWSYNFINRGYDDGASIPDNYEILMHSGAAKYSEFAPIINSTSQQEYRKWCTNTNTVRNALKYRVSQFDEHYYASNSINTPITSYNDADLNLMKSYLNDNHLLTFSTDFNSFNYATLSNQTDSSLNGNYIIIGQYNNNNSYDGHAMTIVGYNDNIWYDLNGDHIAQSYEKGAFKVANSHGTDFMNSGFVWLLYDGLNKKSNCSTYNTSTRGTFIYNYRYYTIEVDECDLNMTADVELKHKYRDDITLKTVSNYIHNNEWFESFLNRNGGPYNFFGNSGSESQATFVFDFGTLDQNTVRKEIYVVVRNDGNPDRLYLTSITLKDKTGKTVVNDTIQENITTYTKTYPYRIGMVGDVDNDASVSSIDATRINMYLADLQSFSDDDIIVADTDGDGDVSIMDATHLQRYLAEIIPVMNNGLYAYLG